MSSTSTITIVLILIIVGLNLTANNAFISLVVTYIFYKDRLAKRLIRMLGIIVALSSVFFIIDQPQIGVYVNVLVVFIFTFLSIRGHNNAMKERMNARDRLLKEYQDEIRKKRERIEELKHHSVEKTKKSGDENLTPDEIRKKIWDDGSMTSKDIINGFKKD